MQFFLHVLPQLAVSAKLLCLLMVVICGAVPSMVRSVKLFSESSHKFVKVSTSGQVIAADEDVFDDYLHLKIASVDFERLIIYSNKTMRHICFNEKWHLVGMESRNYPRNRTRCQFREEINKRGYSTYQSIENSRHFIAFNKKGKPVNKRRRYRERFKNFLKVDEKGFDIVEHNKRISNGNPPRSAYHTTQQPRLRHRPRKPRG